MAKVAISLTPTQLSMILLQSKTPHESHLPLIPNGNRGEFSRAKQGIESWEKTTR